LCSVSAVVRDRRIIALLMGVRVSTLDLRFSLLDVVISAGF
jgi:hypothetical protein